MSFRVFSTLAMMISPFLSLLMQEKLCDCQKQIMCKPNIRKTMLQTVTRNSSAHKIWTFITNLFFYLYLIYIFVIMSQVPKEQTSINEQVGKIFDILINKQVGNFHTMIVNELGRIDQIWCLLVYSIVKISFKLQNFGNIA